MNKVIVAVADPIEEEGLRILADDPEVKLIRRWLDQDEFEHSKLFVSALIVRSVTRVDAALMAGMPRLRVVGRAGIGVDNIDVTTATRRGITVIHVPAASTVSAAEHALALMFSLVRQIPRAHASMLAGEWSRSSLTGQILRDRTLSLIGFGSIAKILADLCHNLGMNVVAYDPFPDAASAETLNVQLVGFEEAMKLGDIVSLHVPLTDSTRHMIDSRTLSLMKVGAQLINTARGGVVDEEALVDAIGHGALAGAALDVFEVEPLPLDSPLRNTPNIILTPHLGASTAEAQAFVSANVCRAIREFLLTGKTRLAVNARELERARSVFISHSTQDREFVQDAIVTFLQNNGTNPWYAPADIKTSAEWERSILKGMIASEWFVLVMSPQSAQSEWVKDEVHWAVKNRPGRLLPVLLEDCEGADFHIRVPRLQYIDFRHDVEEARTLLLQTLRSEIGYDE